MNERITGKSNTTKKYRFIFLIKSNIVFLLIMLNRCSTDINIIIYSKFLLVKKLVDLDNVVSIYMLSLLSRVFCFFTIIF